METDRDPYEVLGVPRGASDDEVKEAYREKAKQFHPDASDREDAAEVFKRVKEAYEEIYTEQKGVSSSSEHPSAETRTGAETEGETDTRTGGDGKRGFGSGEGRATGRGPGDGEPGAGFGGDGYGSAGRHGRDTTKGGFGDAKGENEDDEETGEDEGDPEDFEVHKRLGLGWRLGETEAGSWFVFTESETAPYVDGVRMLYLDGDGRISDDAVYFGTKATAEETYEEHYGVRGGSEHEHQDGWEDSHRGFSPDGESYARRTEERQDGFGDDGWGERVEGAELDELWRLYYQKRERGGADNEARTQRRWGVTTDVAGDDRFVNPSGEYQEVEFWFEERAEAVEAYERYVRNTRAAREGFEDAGTAGARTASAAGRDRKDEGFKIRTASRGYFLYEDLYETTEPIRENRLTAATLATALFAVSAYLFEPFRGLLSFLFLPVYVGVITIAQTPYLLFFVFAYTVIVAAVFVVHAFMNH